MNILKHMNKQFVFFTASNNLKCRYKSFNIHSTFILTRQYSPSVRFWENGTVFTNNITTETMHQMQYATVTQPGILSRLKAKVGLQGKYKHSKFQMNRSAIRLLACTTELVDYNDFFTEFNLSDTFNSWFRITELHVWMVLVRLSQEGKEGKFILNQLMKHLWKDVHERTKKLGAGAGTSARKEGIQILSEQFRAALLGYEEGILDHDRVLAGALWRHFLEEQGDDPEKLELLVHYVRRQTHYLDNQDSNVMIENGFLTFLPLNPNLDLDSEKTKTVLKEIVEKT